MVDMGRVSRSFLGRSADLRHRHIDEVLGGAQLTSLIAISGAGLVLAAAAVATPAAEKIPLLTLQQLPRHQPRHRLHRAETMLASRLTPPASKILQLFPCQHRRATLLIGLLLRSSVLNTRYDRACHPDLQEQ